MSILIGNYVGGFFGSISQLTNFAEGANYCLAAHHVMIYHQQNGLMRTLNGLSSLLNFFVFRMLFFNYMIFWKMQDFCLYRYYTFWHQYPSDLHHVCYAFIAIYIVMFGIQLHWFSKLLFGFLKHIGLDIAIE